jgi:hypothetical protein
MKGNEYADKGLGSEIGLQLKNLQLSRLLRVSQSEAIIHLICFNCQFIWIAYLEDSQFALQGA